MNLHIAMPALMNREAMALMRSGVDANGMTAMQAVWGGTHDMLLATWLWMYRIPLYSVKDVYSGFPLESLKPLQTGEWARAVDTEKVIFVHMLKNFAIPVMNGRNRTGQFKMVPGMLEAAKVFGDDVLYRHMGSVTRRNRSNGKSRARQGSTGGGLLDRSSAAQPQPHQGGSGGGSGGVQQEQEHVRRAWKAKYNEQISRGKVASRVHLSTLSRSRVGETDFGASAARLHEEYTPFLEHHCPVRAEGG
jgi:hypothetical protein